MNDTTLTHQSQDLFYEIWDNHNLKAHDIRTLAAFCVVSIGANKKNFNASVSTRQLAEYTGTNYDSTQRSIRTLIKKGILTCIDSGNGLSAPLYSPNDEVVNLLSLVKIELQKYWVVNKDIISSINTYKDSLFTTWEKSWLLSPATASNPASMRVCAAMSVKGLSGAKAIGSVFGVSARAIRRTLHILNDLGIVDGGKLDGTKEYVYEYLGLEDYIDREEYTIKEKIKKRRLDKYRLHMINRRKVAADILRHGRVKVKSITTGFKDVRKAKKTTYSFNNGKVSFIDPVSKVALYSCNVYDDVVRYDLSTAQKSRDMRFLEKSGFNDRKLVTL